IGDADRGGSRSHHLAHYLVPLPADLPEVLGRFLGLDPAFARDRLQVGDAPYLVQRRQRRDVFHVGDVDGPIDGNVLDERRLLRQGSRRPWDFTIGARHVQATQIALPAAVVAILPAVVAEQRVVAELADAKVDPRAKAALGVDRPEVIAEIVMSVPRPYE